jgi:hypothetical protein
MTQSITNTPNRQMQPGGRHAQAWQAYHPEVPKDTKPKFPLCKPVGDAKALDPQHPLDFPSDGGARTITIGDTTVTYETVAASSTFDSFQDIDTYERDVEQNGKPDTGAVSDQYVAAGAAWMGEILPCLKDRRLSLPHWRGEDEVVLRMAEARGRAFLMAPEVIEKEIEKQTGLIRAYVPRKSHVATGCMAKELDAQRAEVERIEVEAARQRELALVAAERDILFSELEGSYLRVKPFRVRRGKPSPIFQSATNVNTGLNEGFSIVGLSSYEALPLPAFDEENVSTIRGDEVVPKLHGTVLLHAVPGPDQDSWQWTREMRALFGTDLDFGPIAKDRFRSDDDTVKAVKEVALRYQRHLTFADPASVAMTMQSMKFLHVHAVEIAVRGLLGRPDIVAPIFAAVSQQEIDRRTPTTITVKTPLHMPGQEWTGNRMDPTTSRTFRNPVRERETAPGDGSLAYWGTLAAQAAGECPGGVSAGCLALSEEKNATFKSTPTKSKKNR